MADQLLTLRMTEQAEIQHSSLGPENRRLIDAWFDHLRHWQTDEFIRTHSRRLQPDDGTYLFQNGGDLVIAFQVTEDEVLVRSIFRKEVMGKFGKALERTAP